MRIIHAADFHLDSPFDGLSPEQAVQRRAEQRQILDRLAELTGSTQADVVLLPGDLLDGDRVYYETVEALARTLAQIKVPVFIAPGNHDYYTPRSPYAVTTWPENVHIFRSGQIESVELPELNCVVYGTAFTTDGRGESLLEGFSVPDDDKLHLMVLHADVDARQGSRYCPISTADIAASGLDYLALGHIHTCSGVQMAGNVPWAYSGCPEGRGFDETGVKGVLCGEIAHGRADLRFVPLCQRQYQIHELAVTAEDDNSSIANKALFHAAPNDLVRFVLTGESDDGAIDPTELQNRCADAFFSVSFRDRTRLRQDIWARMDEENLTGLFLRTMKQKLTDARDEEQIALLQKAIRFGLAALENREDIAP